MGAKQNQQLVVTALHDLAKKLGRTPTRREFRETGLEQKLINCFGTFTIALQACGFDLSEKKNVKFSYKQSKMDSFNIHDLNLQKIFKDAGNPSSVKVVCQPDTHVPFHDERALGAFISFCKWYQPHVYMCLGDFLDCEPLSHWPAKDASVRRFVPEALRGREVLKEIVDANKNAVRLIYLEGNHEDWITQALSANVPEFVDGIEKLGIDLSLKKILDLESMGVDLFPVNDIVKLGNAHFTHGLYTGSSHAKKHLDTLKASIYYGHIHDVQKYNDVSMFGGIEAASLGCLCRLDAKFMKGKPNKWAHGFGVFEFFLDGSYTFYLPTIVNGRFSYNGKIFISK